MESFTPGVLLTAASSDQVTDLLSEQSVDILVFDGLHPPSFAHKFWESDGLSAVLVFDKPLKWVKGASGLGWKVTSVPLTHTAALGGVTGRRGNLNVPFQSQLGAALDPGPLMFEPVGVQTFLSQLVDQTTKGGVSCPPPSAGTFDASADKVLVEQIRAPDCHFVLPSVFAKMGFVQQKFTYQEHLLAIDFPSTASGFLTEVGCAALVLDMICIPVKAIIQVREQLDSGM